MRLMRAGTAALAFMGVTFCANTSIAATAPLTIDKQLLLAEHNKYRADVGAPPLTWSDKLAGGAQKWADTIALLDQMQHSHTSGVGENLAYWRGSNASLSTLIGMWEAERRLFQFGTFPDVSSDGNWLSVAHYTQMVWRDTTKVGCGIGNNGKTDFLVCWYSPQGNYIGRVPY